MKKKNIIKALADCIESKIFGEWKHDGFIDQTFSNAKSTVENEYKSLNRVLFMDEEKIDYVNHPPHYQSKKGMEVIDVIEAFTEGLEGVEATDTGNIIKYICRWKKKNGIEDLKKIEWYLKHLIKHVEKKEKSKKWRKNYIVQRMKVL